MKTQSIILSLVVGALSCLAARAEDDPLTEAKGFFSEKEFIKAIESAAAVVKENPDGPHVAQARLLQARALFELGRVSTAVVLADEVIGIHPKSEFVPDSWLVKGDCYFILGRDDREHYSHAMVCYHAVVKNPQAKPDLVTKARQAITRCEEKLGKDMPNHRIESDFDTRAKGAATEAPHP